MEKMLLEALLSVARFFLCAYIFVKIVIGMKSFFKKFV